MVCHKSKPPAKHMVAVHLQDLVDPAWDMQLTLTCLQGLVNRREPRLFLVQDKYDELWLEWLQERGDILRVEWLLPREALLRFAPQAEGLIVVDPAVPASFNVATMLAGVRGMLVTTPRMASRGKLGRGSVVDLRAHCWESDVAAYRWFYDRHWEDISHRMVVMLDPYDLPLRDYAVTFCLPLIWVKSENSADEMAMAERVLSSLPPNIPCLGWPQADCSPDTGLGEHMGVILVNEYAKFQVCSAFERVSRAVSNLTVHSGTTAELANKSKPLPALEDKVYMALIRTDGDGPNFYRECYRSLWDDPQHGRFPMGWQLGPTMVDLMPDILDWYYKRATENDYFVNALTGIGYIHEENYAYMYPSEERDQIWAAYLDLSLQYRERLGLDLLTTYHEMSGEKMEAFCRLGFKGVFANYHRSFITTLHNQVQQVAGIPVIRACNQGGSVESLVSDIRRWTPKPRPAFLYVSLTNWLTRMEYVESAIKLLAPEYEAVTPEQLIGLYQQSLA
jgi:hypothetical protein